ncbi:hypothetical protein ACQUFE_18530, partial [Enterococcus casseliflavus]|uniref:hypothetical protein n=1 Tax=Enterococcus casseliflavus TaxID=37734 RepID=UPI003D1336E2
IGAGEYAAKYVTSGGQTWWMQWDDTALYLALQNANVGEAAVFYLGLGSGVGGITTGQPYDGLTPTLPVPANLVVYAKS